MQNRYKILIIGFVMLILSGFGALNQDWSDYTDVNSLHSYSGIVSHDAQHNPYYKGNKEKKATKVAAT